MVTMTMRFVVAAGLIGAALGVAAPAGADPADDPCQLAVTFLCRFLPIAPDLDHDVDLSQDPGAFSSQPLPETPAVEPVPQP